MRNLTELERAEIQAITDQVAKTFKTRSKQADGATGATEAEFNNSGQVNFSDTGNTKQNFSDFAEYSKAAKAETALFTIKRLVARAGVQDSIKKYLTQRNAVIKANKAKQKEKEKAKENRHVSKPFWY